MIELLISLFLVIGASVIISYSCNSFDEASAYLGRNMKPGIRGATINAVGSSLPELFTTCFLLFVFHDQGGFSAGIATTAGSAIFNTVVIPMLCIMTVAWRGIKTGEGGFKKIKEITLSKEGIIRDAVFLLVAEILLIYFLGGTHLAWWMGLAMILVYVVYFKYLMRGFHTDIKEEQGLSNVFTDKARKTKFRALLTFDFNELFFGGRAYSSWHAWIVLSLSILVVSIACYALAEAVMLSAIAMGIPPYFTAVVFAAAASSVPDTILSVKDASRGDYDDALSNALGSNIFDITIALGLPLMAYSLIYGDISLLDENGDSDSQIQTLRIILVAVTVIVLGFLLQKKITIKTAYVFAALYIGWLCYILYGAIDVMMN